MRKGWIPTNLRLLSRALSHLAAHFNKKTTRVSGFKKPLFIGAFYLLLIFIKKYYIIYIENKKEGNKHMSQYMHFFAYPNSIGNTFIQIDAFSRNNAVYQIANQAIDIPYEAIAYISKNNLQKCIDITQGYIACKKETITNYNKKIDIISEFNNTVEEKLTAIDDCYIRLKECENILKVSL